MLLQVPVVLALVALVSSVRAEAEDALPIHDLKPARAKVELESNKNLVADGQHICYAGAAGVDCLATLEVERVSLSNLNQQQCNDVLLKKGFFKRKNADDPVPEEFLEGPYTPKQEL
ncbi:hypothetical protein HAZT_HAZT004193 [Hyalella azteca]|uniref:Uncharacterized protein n=1 Tax=Hyalella azteca TaxID=294128 RepID=A0A6A0HB90_HYAAZ|nr:hypothetical protein HAZT_HAZT004193 [Hyalella azteca]